MAADNSIQGAKQKLDAFISGPDHPFAPATAARAQAYLGAAMLAEEKGAADEVNEGIARALATLKEAEDTAARFREQFPDLLRLKEDSMETLAAIGTVDPLQEPNPKRLMQAAEQQLGETVKLFESGDLNRSRQAAEKTEQLYQQLLDAALPVLVDRTGVTLSKAAAASAKSYAPQSYKAAKAALMSVEQYVNGLSRIAPEHPAYALKLAERALEIARQVKIWRKEKGSHEGMILKARNDRLALARALEMPVDPADPTADVSIEALTRALAGLQADLAREKAARKAERKRLEAHYKAQLKQHIEQQRASLMARQNEQLSGLKEAFRAKLERETFESKRQKQVRNLFRKGEVELLVNLDGSLLIRLSSLRFAPGSSKVDAAYYDLLGRVKQALEIYGERSVSIEGHTDSQGDVKLNRKISLKRAEAVRDFLIAAGMDGSRLKALGYGEVRPIASNQFKKGRAMNRRIDLVIEAAHD